MHTVGKDSLHTQKELTVGNKTYHYFSIKAAEKALGTDLSRLPYSLKVLLENLLRFEDGRSVTTHDIKALAAWLENPASGKEIAYHPTRVLMQDFTGVPAVVDLAAMRNAMLALKGNPSKINPLVPVDLVIDHSVQVDNFGNKKAFHDNVQKEIERNLERYAFLRWGQKAFDNFRVVPPGTGICHQVNLEYLAQVVWSSTLQGKSYAYPDTLVGTDSHTTMVNGLSVLGWGVGGIEAEAAMLNQPISMLIPEVTGFRLTGKLREGATATDLVLTVTQMLRKAVVVGKFVEFYGPGLDTLAVADRATIANMAPEYGATCGFFPIDEETIKYLALTARSPEQIALVKAYAKEQGLWHDRHSMDPVFSSTLELDLGTVEPSLAGPRRPQDRIALSQAAASFEKELPSFGVKEIKKAVKTPLSQPHTLSHGDIVIAAITSCTNTSNPSVMLAAGLVARKARALGLVVKPWVKTSFAPGSKVVTEYMQAAHLQDDLDHLGFNLVGYGCTTCIGNSGPLPDPVSEAIEQDNLVVASVLSGNRNFEGRIHSLVKANYLASPPLVVAYALAGSIQIDLFKGPLGKDNTGKDVFLKDIWPANHEIADLLATIITPSMFSSRYADVFTGDSLWQSIAIPEEKLYDWRESTYIKHPPYFQGMQPTPQKVDDITHAHILALLGDSITTDHISPAGSIAKTSPAAHYLQAKGIAPSDFNSYGSRRGNDDVMVRGTFANIRIRNEMAQGKEGGFTTHIPSNEPMTIYDAAMRYKENHIPLVVIAGKEYGTGSSRDWAAKGTLLLGVKAVIAESFERIHRSNLVGMGILPLVFIEGTTRKTLNLTGYERITIKGLAKNISPKKEVTCEITYKDHSKISVPLICRLDTADEVTYYLHGGILHRVIRSLLHVA